MIFYDELVSMNTKARSYAMGAHISFVSSAYTLRLELYQSRVSLSRWSHPRSRTAWRPSGYVRRRTR